MRNGSIGGEEAEKPLPFSLLERAKDASLKDLKQPVTMRLHRDTVAYFRSMAEQIGNPGQSLSKFYLRDCAVHHGTLQMKCAA